MYKITTNDIEQCRKILLEDKKLSQEAVERIIDTFPVELTDFLADVFKSWLTYKSKLEDTIEGFTIKQVMDNETCVFPVAVKLLQEFVSETDPDKKASLAEAMRIRPVFL